MLGFPLRPIRTPFEAKGRGDSQVIIALSSLCEASQTGRCSFGMVRSSTKKESAELQERGEVVRLCFSRCLGAAVLVAYGIFGFISLFFGIFGPKAHAFVTHFQPNGARESGQREC